jgi:hypothetical protein
LDILAIGSSGHRCKDSLKVWGDYGTEIGALKWPVSVAAGVNGFTGLARHSEMLCWLRLMAVSPATTRAAVICVSLWRRVHPANRGRR